MSKNNQVDEVISVVSEIINNYIIQKNIEKKYYILKIKGEFNFEGISRRNTSS